MRDLFPGYYAPKDFQELWDKATFVLDANVLLNLYRFPKSAAQGLLDVLEKVSERLWLPHQAALEYQLNRLTVINEQRAQFNNVKNALKDAVDGLQKAFNKLQLKKRHSSIDPDPLLLETRKLFNEFEKNLDQLEKDQPDVSDRDEIRDRIEKLLVGKVGAPPKSQAELDQIYSDGKKRYQDKRPPGYKDTDKGRDSASSTYFVNNLRFEREYGDIVLWRQILDHAKQRQVQHLILIIDDNKEDWWQSIGGKKIGPQPELIDEITSESGVKTFHMYASERFLEFAKGYLKEQVKQESIDQIRDVKSAATISTLAQLTSTVVRDLVVRNWLNIAHPRGFVERQRGVFPDYIVTNPDRVRIGYQVQTCPDQFIFSTLIENVQRANLEIEHGTFDTFVVIFVLADTATAFEKELREQIDRMPEVHGPRVSFIISIVVRSVDDSGVPRTELIVLQEFL
jgi:PIN like domain